MFRRHLLLWGLNNLPLYLAPEGEGAGGEGEGDSLERDLADLDDDEPPKPKEGEGDEDEEPEPEIEEEGDEEDPDKKAAKKKEGEEDEEEDEEEKAKKAAAEVDASGRPTVKALKAAYPDLFKKFPYLRTAFFEYPKLAEVFPDVESAQTAAEKANEYDALESSLVEKGDAGLLVKTLSENNPKALAKVVESFPEAVRAVDVKLYQQIATPIIEELLYYAANHARKLGTEQGQPGRNILLAAQHLANFVFVNGGEIPDITKRGKPGNTELSEEEKKLQKDREEFNQQRYNIAMGEVETKITGTLNEIIGRKLDTLTSFERKSVIKDTRREIDQALLADKALQRQLRGLWKRAADDGYSESSKSSIMRAWLDRARAIAPGIRNRLRQEALDARTPGKGDATNTNDRKRQFPGSGGRAPKSSSGVLDPKKIDWKTTTDEDILNS